MINLILGLDGKLRWDEVYGAYRMESREISGGNVGRQVLEQGKKTLTNVWYRRLVSEDEAKACWICYRPSVVVLICDGNIDFFYTCSSHLQDSQFCTPLDSPVYTDESNKEKLNVEKVNTTSTTEDSTSTSKMMDDNVRGNSTSNMDSALISNGKAKFEHRIFRLHKIFFAERKQIYMSSKNMKTSSRAPRTSGPLKLSQFPSVPRTSFG